MTEISQQVEIPNRALFKAAEVCDLAKVQPYVLRSWEAEFKDLGIAKGGAGTRVYRREDVELVLRIKHLLLVEGLTLAGVRRRLDEEAEPPLEDVPIVAAPAPLAADARARIGDVKRGLRSLLNLLGGPVATSSAPIAAAAEFALAPPAEAQPTASKAARRGTANEEGTKSASPRRKRSA
jgi:DNA-binding transcriptional MerR regulator